MVALFGQKMYHVANKTMRVSFFFCGAITQIGHGPLQYWGLYITKNSTQTHTHTHTHPAWLLWAIGHPKQLPTQNTTNKTDEHPYPQRHSNPRSSYFSPTPSTARPPGTVNSILRCQSTFICKTQWDVIHNKTGSYSSCLPWFSRVLHKCNIHLLFLLHRHYTNELFLSEKKGFCCLK